MKNLKLTKLKYSDDFRNLLTSIIDNLIAKDLLKIEGKLYFLPFNNVNYIQNTNKVTVSFYKNDTSINVEMKIGKFITKLYTLVHKRFTNEQVEEFVNTYKGMVMFDETFANFHLVQGTDIKKYYHYSNYQENKGVLGNSCMKHDSLQKVFKIYTKNTDKVSLLILKDPNTGKIRGRAIVWKNINMRAGSKESGVKSIKVNFMDRIYSYDDSVTEQFKMYAKINGWMYKQKQNSGPNGPFIFENKILPNDTKLFFYLDYFDKIKKYPYLDTLSKFSIEKGFISNRKFKDCVELTSTDGHFYTI